MIRRGVAAASGLIALACTGTPYRLPIPVDYDHEVYRDVGYAEGYAVGRWCFYIPFGFTDTVERATRQAIQKNGGDAITDVIVTERYTFNPFCLSRGVRVRGLVLREETPGTRDLPPSGSH